MDTLLNKTKEAQKELLKLSNADRNLILERINKALIQNSEDIINANLIDLENAKLNNMPNAMLDRLKLDDKRIKAIADSILDIRNLPDYIGEVIEELKPKSTIKIKKIRVPFGVIAVIFESRPNVCVDIATLCLKTANACVLKGGSDAINTNMTLVEVMKNAIKDIVNPDVITLIETTDRKATDELLTKKEYIDLLIPRGSKGLIQYVVNNSKVPFIETGAGNCHLYIHEDANIEMAVKIAINAKYQRPSVCNAIETLLVDEKISEKALPRIYEEFKKLNIEMRGCEKTRKIIDCKLATDDDYYKEYNDYIIAIKVVKNIDEAISHINKYSTKHSEAIITENKEAYIRFFNEIDSACVYHNASTRFSDGGEFGLGAEIGISTSKLHARGPMGLREITTFKYIIEGNGEVR